MRLSAYVKQILKGSALGPAWELVRSWRTRADLALFQSRDVHHRYGGVLLTVHLIDSVGHEWYDHDWAPLPELELLRQHQLQPGARVFELGAHQGVIAMMLAHSVGPSGSVVAVEANPRNCALARRNAERNAVANLTVLHNAVAERDGSVIFNVVSNAQRMKHGTSLGGTVSVPAVTLDTLAAEHGRPNVVFMDVEGGEYLALTGATATLAARPDLFIEVHVGCGLERLGGSLAALTALLPPKAYRLLMANDVQREYRPFDPRDQMVQDRFFIVAIALP
jgi:FkbM family methyltransferase